MTTRARRFAIGQAALAALVFAPSMASAEPRAEAVAQAPTAPTVRLNPLGVRPLDGATLARQRGGSSDIFSDMKLKGVVADNQAYNLSTGSNFIADGAFTNASGVPMVVQNSGNNVLIQSATIVNVQVK